MSYLKKIEYEIVLKDSFFILRSCPKCGRKTHFKNTKKFRVNANGNKLDIWLIYQCENCRHTFHLAIYERQKVSSIPTEEYRCFLENNEPLADTYGKNMQLFRKNKADIDMDRLNYDFVKLRETTESSGSEAQIAVVVYNPYQLKLRPEKQIAGVFGWTRSQVKSLMEQDRITLEKISPQFISVRIPAYLFDRQEANENNYS